MQNYPSNNYYTTPELRTGYADSTGITRSYLKFSNSLPNLNGGLLVNAELKAYKQSDIGTTINTTAYLQKVTSSWASNTITWNNQPSIDTSKTYGFVNANGGAAWLTWNVTDLVNDWYNGTANNGVVLRSNWEGTAGTYRKFNSSESSSGQPYLSVTYSDKPSAPTGAPYGNGSGTSSGYVNLNWASVAGATGYKVLIFNGINYDEIDVGNVTTWTTKGKKLWPTKAQIASGQFKIRTDGTGEDLADDPRPVYINSKGTYQTNKNYAFRIKAYNKYGTTTESAAFSPTIPDQTKPTQPGKPSLTNPLNSQFTFTWQASTDTNTGVQKYLVFIGKSSGAVDVVNGRETSGTSFTYPQAGDPPLDPRLSYYFYVRAVDGNGNISDNSMVGNGIARLPRDARVVSYSLPDSMEAGETGKKAFITVENAGIETWTAAANFMLGSINKPDYFSNKETLLLESTDSIATGQMKTFEWDLNGGKDLGTFPTAWQMLKIGTGWFGDTTAKNIPVVDTTPPTGNILINGGDAYTNNPNVTLTLKNVNDNANGELLQKFQNEDSPFGPYEPFTLTRSWLLSERNGDKRVSVVLKDASGNESAPSSATIKLDTSLPTAKISTPQDAQFVNGMVDVKGNATDDDFDHYTVSYGEGDSPASWTTITTEIQSTSDGLLARWDTKNLPTGKYTVKLEVMDKAENVTTAVRTVWVDQPNQLLGMESFWGIKSIVSGFGSGQVNLTNGNLVLSYVDASLDGRQLNPSISRFYNSQDSRKGLLGEGWRLSVETKVHELSDGSFQYSDEDGSIHLFAKNSDGSYTAPKGIFKKAIKSVDGHFSMTDLTPSSIMTSFNLDGSVSSISDKNHNKIEFHYQDGVLSSIQDDVGRSIDFHYNSFQLVDSITLYDGNKINYEYDQDHLLATVKYSDSNHTSYRELHYLYDSNRLIKSVDPNGNEIVYGYNGWRMNTVETTHRALDSKTGALLPPVKVTDAFIYDIPTKKVSIETSGRALSSKTDFQLNNDGNVMETITDPFGLNLKETSVYRDHLLVESTDGKGYKTFYEYDSLGNLIKKTDPAVTDIEGSTMTPISTIEYKPGANLVSKEIDPLGRITSYEYDQNGNRTKMIDSEGFHTTWEYDSYGNVLKQTNERGPLYGYIPNFGFEQGANPADSSWKLTGTTAFDSSVKKSGTRSLQLTGNTVVESDFITIKKGKLPVRGLLWVKTQGLTGTGVVPSLVFYNDQKNILSTKELQAITGTTDWTLVHLASAVPDGAAYVTLKVKSDTSTGTVWLDDLWMEEANITQTFHYSENGLYVTSKTDPYGNVSSYEYDQAGNKIAETNSLHQTARFVYDADRKVVEAVDRLGKKTLFEYDKVGNLLKETNPAKQVTEYAYDEHNHQIVKKNPKVTTINYVGQTPQEPEVHSITELYMYNALGQKVEEKDGNGGISTYEYDRAGRLVKTVDPVGNYRLTSYDANDNKVKEEDYALDKQTSVHFLKGTTYYQYDQLNRMTSYTDASGSPNAIIEKTEYDAVNNPIKKISGTGVVTDYFFDKNNQSIYSKDSSTPAVETWALYDGTGNAAVSYDKQGAVQSIYDANGLLLAVVDAEGKRTTYSYNSVGDKIKQQDATGTETNWEYDSEGQLIKETVKMTDPSTNASKLQITDYQYNDLGQVVKKVIKEEKDGSSTTSKEVTLAYDELGRGQKETSVTNGLVTESRYVYDNNGNVIHNSL